MRRLGMAVRSCAALAQRWTPRNAGTNPVTPISTVRAQFARYALKRNGGSTTACSEFPHAAAARRQPPSGILNHDIRERDALVFGLQTQPRGGVAGAIGRATV